MDADVAEDVSAIGKIDAVQKILEVVCRITGLGFSAVARVTESRWIACAVRDQIAFGLTPGGELELHTTICDEIRDSGQPVIIEHVAEDPNFKCHPTPAKYGFQSYISFPIHLPDGRFFGTLCAIDPRPALLKKPETIGMFKLFADLIAMHLDAQERMAASEAALGDERKTAQLRDQFIAVLGHDLRNPLNAVHSGAQLLRRMPHSEDSNEVIEIIQRSSARMAALIDNLLDFARGRLGGGLPITRATRNSLDQVLKHVVTELQTANSSRTIHTEIRIDAPVFCDPARIGQLLSNLLGNALTHGDSASPIWVAAESDSDAFELSVTNHGQSIPPRIMDRLFEPFSRGSERAGQEGLGLGLFISAEIARAHQGKLSVTSVDGETRFTFRMPGNLGSGAGLTIPD